MGFEPTVFYNTPVFKTGTLSRSVIHPKKIFMNNLLQIGKTAPNFLTVGIYKNRLGKIRLSDYHGKKYVLLVFCMVAGSTE